MESSGNRLQKARISWKKEHFHFHPLRDVEMWNSPLSHTHASRSAKHITVEQDASGWDDAVGLIEADGR